MHYFDFKKRNLFSGPHLLGSLFLIAGLFALLSPLIFESESSPERILGVGAGAIILGLLIVTSYSGTLIDFTNRRLQEYSSICGFKFGEWTTLPAISTVKVISTSYINTSTPNGISPTLSGKVTDFRTLMYSNDSTPVLSFVYSNREKAVKHAECLASHLHADLIL